MDIVSFLFTSKGAANPDPVWFMGAVIGCSILLLLLGTFGRKWFSKKSHLALHKTLKKSSGWLKFFGITYLILLWFRLESLRFLSMKFWWGLSSLLLLWILIRKYSYYRKLKRRIVRGQTERKETHG